MGVRRLSCLMTLALISNVSAELVGYWQFNEATGTTTGDSSGNDNVGTLVGTPQWAAGYHGNALQFNGQDSYVEIPSSDSLTATYQVSVAAWTNWTDTGDSWLCILANGRQLGPWENYGLFVNRASRFAYFTVSLDDTHVPQRTEDNTVAPGEWHHLCGTWDGLFIRVYIDGELMTEEAKSGALTSPRLPLRLGHRNDSTHYYSGLMDDVAVFNHALTQREILNTMWGRITSTELANDPRPENTAADVPYDTPLGWTPGRFAAAHNVYFGAVFADVNDASRDDPLGVLASESQTIAEFVPGSVKYGQTYYWRIDEVNAAPDNTIFKGNTWRFTVEPYAYPLTAVAATASGFEPNMGPENTINGAGLDADDQHGTEPSTLWMTDGGEPAWIQYEFDRVYKLDEMWVWNLNQTTETLLDCGAKAVTIEYSTDGWTWTPLADVPEFAKATGEAAYAHNTTVSFGGALARYVRIMIDAAWDAAAPQTGLSEVRFFYVPLQAFEPKPADATTGVPVETNLDWRPGREAISHRVYFGGDRNEVAGNAALEVDRDNHSYTPPALNFATTYYWRVDETGDTETYAGDIWSFRTQNFAAIDDFESYGDDADAETVVWRTWIDGLTDGNSGSQVGYDESPFAERSVVHGGKQSMPLIYDNTVLPYYSEAERTFSSPQDWTAHEADSLCVYYQGLAANSAEGLYLTATDSSGKSKTVACSNATATTTTSWQLWTIPLSEFTSAGVKVTAVKSIVVGVGNRTNPTVGGTGTVYIDDIGYGRSAQ